jgi:putative MFS transporter
MTTTAVTVAARLDRLPVVRTHKVATVIVGLGLFFDAYENFLAGTIAKVLQKDFSLGGTELKLVLASAFVGQFLGALYMGRVADRFGRRPAFLINLALYSVASLVGAFSMNAPFLIVTRFIAGIGIGAEYALADSYLSDVLPRAVRGRYIAWAYTLAFVGVPAVGFLARWLVPLEPLGVSGWRWLFVLGGIGSALIWVARSRLPESPRWLETVGRTEEAEAEVARMEDEAREAGLALPEPDLSVQPVARVRTPLVRLFQPPYARRTTMLWLLSGLEVFGYYGFGTLAPLVLAAKGYTVLSSLTFVALSYLGYPIGSLLSVPLVERFERKLLVMGGAALMAVFGLGFGFAPSAGWVVAFGVLFTVTSNFFSNAYHIYLAEQYPTAVRGTAAGAAYSISKIVTAALPFILLPVLDSSGGGAVFTVVAVAMALLVLEVGLLGTRTTGRSVDTAGEPEPQRVPA